MSQPTVFEFSLTEEIGRHFDDSSLSAGEPPRIVVLMGGVAGGKTTFRKQNYATGYVLVDAAEIFLHLSRGEFIPFPGRLEQLLDAIGRAVAERAVSEKRHIVTEIIGADGRATESLLMAMTSVGYHVALKLVNCDVEEAMRRNLSREDDSISCYYTEPYQRGWLQGAVASINK